MTGWPDQLAFIGQFADELRDQDSGVAKVFVSIACPKDAAPQPPPEVSVTRQECLDSALTPSQ
jgi:hypothetical protein